MNGPQKPRGRPHASSREQIAQHAFELFLERGFAATTIASIAKASGVSKTSFFRYYSSKSEIIWLAFDQHIDRLQTLLQQSDPGLPSLTAVRLAVLDALTRDTARDAVWRQRFVLFDSSPELRDEESAHWNAWAGVISAFLVLRTGCPVEHAVPPVVGGAVQSLVLAKLRSWLPLTDPARTLADWIDDDLRPLCEALQPWVDASCGTPRRAA
ncbi:TetR family transcriptional regulator [Subtercola sp. Z020]|uniref:acyl-CoA-like ligand-binding transcription factor n=1 Tax=Subtercola sp. Z020 TaxID=2080582 RepID=UPI000CE8DD30|nr:TetR family transcriptional regulator [Subtercola sp. Z020]PPF78795.1 TetR family transcriptional regulator [Subtercola sp. Z020]